MVGEWVDLLMLESMCCQKGIWVDCIFFPEVEEAEGVFVFLYPGVDCLYWWGIAVFSSGKGFCLMDGVSLVVELKGVKDDVKRVVGVGLCGVAKELFALFAVESLYGSFFCLSCSCFDDHVVFVTVWTLHTIKPNRNIKTG